MTGRNAARERTRESILDAALELFPPSYYDEVTLADVARRAGVSQQTVVNHFGSKSQLYLTGMRERWVPGILRTRARAVPGEVDSIVATVCADYERTGDATVRSLGIAARVPEIAELAAGGRLSHRAWVTDMFADLLPDDVNQRALLVDLLAVVLDVRTWHQLRRESRLGKRATQDRLTTLVRALLPTPG